MSNLPTISIIIPTLNAARTLGLCLESIREQDYPKEQVEVLMADGGSTDGTQEVAERYRVDRILDNPLKTGEAGKAVAVDASQHDILAFIDSDNILESRDWLRKMVRPFEDPEVVGAEPLMYTYRRKDSLITRYSALMGLGDPLCYFIGNYDRYNWITGRWTDLSLRWEDRGGYLKVHLNERHLPTMGANGFLIRRDAILGTSYKPYLFDIDVIYEMIQQRLDRFAKVKVGVVHLFAGDVGTFARKQQRRIRDFLYYQRQDMRKYPWGGTSKIKLLRFILSTVLVFPLLIDASRGSTKVEDVAWFFHLPACWITLGVYGGEFLLDRLTGGRAALSRVQWTQMGGR